MPDMEFSTAKGLRLIEYNGLNDFQGLWNLRLDWHEPPNFRRNGWSGVARHVFRRPDGDSQAVYIKRQLNHCCRTFRHPLKGIPTLRRELRNIQRLAELNIGTAELLYYGEQKTREGIRAILVTRALDDFRSLDDWHFANPAAKDDPEDIQLIRAVAETLATLHQHRIQHSCLYGKHILVREGHPRGRSEQPEYDIRLIDLEKARRRCSILSATLHDMDQLLRHTPAWFTAHHALCLEYHPPGRRKRLTRGLRRRRARRHA